MAMRAISCIRIVVIITALLCSSLSSAAPVLSAESSRLSAAIDQYIDVYLDSSGSLTIEDLSEYQYSRNFAPLTRDQAKFGFTSATVWLRLHLQNATAADDRYFLQFMPVSISTLSIYERSKKSGSATTRIFDFKDSERYSQSVMTPGFLISLGHYDPGETKQLVFKINSEHPINIDARLYSAQSLGVDLFLGNGIYAFLFGGMLCVFLLSLFFLFYSRERIFSYYMLYALAVLGYFRSVWGYPAFFRFDEFVYSSNTVYLFGIFISTLQLLITRRILKGTHTQSRVSTLIYFALFVNLIAMLAFFMVDVQTGFYVFYAAHIIGSIISLTAIVLAYMEKQTNHLLLYLCVNGLNFLLIFATAIAAVVDLSTIVLGGQLLGIIAFANLVLGLVALVLFEQRKQMLEKVIQLKSENQRSLESQQIALLGQMADEIRSPASGVFGMNELLRSTHLSEQQLEYAQGIEKSSQQLLRKMSDFAILAQIKSNTLPRQYAVFSVLKILDDLITSLRTETSSRNINIMTSLSPESMGFVNGDALRTQHIIHTMLVSRISKLRDADLKVDLSFEPHKFEILLSDNGPELLQVDPENFFHLRHTDKSVRDGDSLPGTAKGGLSLAGIVTDSLGGVLDLNGADAGGAQLRLVLPFEQMNEPDLELAGTERLRGLRILLVEPNTVYRHVLERQIRNWGADVELSKSTSEALAQLRAKTNLGQQYDIVLFEYVPTARNGQQLSERLYADELIDSDNLLVMMFFSGNSATRSELGTDYQVHRTISKPIASKDLLQIVLEELYFAERRSAATHLEKPEALQSIAVLLCEADDISARVMEYMLESIGVASQRARTGDDVLRVIQQRPFQLVLMTCSMTPIDGFETTEMVRRWERESGRARTPVIGLSGHVLERIDQQVRASGMDTHVVTPLRIFELHDLLKRWVPEFRDASIQRD